MVLDVAVRAFCAQESYGFGLRRPRLVLIDPREKVVIALQATEWTSEEGCKKS